MSTHTQHLPSANTVAGRDTNVEKTLRMAVIMAEANERLFKLQSDAANAAFSENAKHLKSLLATKDSGSLLTEWAGLYQANMRRILEVSRIGFEIVPETQAKMAAVMGEPFNTYTKETQKYLDQSLLTEWAGLYQANMRRILEVSRIGFEIVPETQAKMAAVMGEPFNTYTKETQKYLDQYVKAIADGRDTAAAKVKEFLAQTMASVSGAQDPKKAKVS